MHVSAATRPAPGTVNEDTFLLGPRYAAVLDGCTDPGRDSGCIHDVPWLVARLSGHLGTVLTHNQGPLTELVGEAISRVCADHRDSCDLSNPDSPSSTVTVVRELDGAVEYLALGDSPLLLESGDGGVEFVCDDQVDHLASYALDDVAAARNAPGGFWVASTDPAAPMHGVRGELAHGTVRSALLMSDGVSRLGERYDYSWRAVLDLIATDGPSAAIDAVHRCDAQPRVPATSPGRSSPSKRFDDATAALCRMDNVMTNYI